MVVRRTGDLQEHRYSGHGWAIKILMLARIGGRHAALLKIPIASDEGGFVALGLDNDVDNAIDQSEIKS